MSVTAKAAIGTLGVGGVGVTGCYALGVFASSYVSYLIGEDDWNTEYNASEKSNVGKDYGYLLVGTYNEKNQQGWEKMYEIYKSEEDTSLSTEFKDTNKATAGFGKKTDDDSKKYLNKLCEVVYKKPLTDITPSDSDANKGLLEKNLWKFCSPLGKKPKSVKDGGDAYSPKNGADDKKDKLVSVKSQDNDLFWIRKDEWFKALKTRPSDGFFKSFEGKGETIKSICEEAYGLTKTDNETDTNKPKEDNVVKYCSIQANVY